MLLGDGSLAGGWGEGGGAARAPGPHQAPGALHSLGTQLQDRGGRAVFWRSLPGARRSLPLEFLGRCSWDPKWPQDSFFPKPD